MIPLKTWSSHDEELAAVTANRIVIDRHNWYSFRPTSERASRLTDAKTGNLTDWALRRHFRGEHVTHLIAVPATALIPTYGTIPTWGWIGFDIQSLAGSIATESWGVTLVLIAQLSKRGCRTTSRIMEVRATITYGSRSVENPRRTLSRRSVFPRENSPNRFCARSAPRFSTMP